MAGHFYFALLLAASVLRAAAESFQPAALSGQTFVHDPSSIIQDGDTYFLFSTGPGIRVKYSPDLIHWSNASAVFWRPPPWTEKAVPGFSGTFWAPDIVRINGKCFLYYSVSTFGKQTSAIGLATNTSVDELAEKFRWRDCGEVIRSSPSTAYNAIDPSAFLDSDGRLWLAFGSYWQGIFLTELDPQTGKRIAANSPLHHLAWNHSIEASCLTRHQNFYYLFVNWGQCCKGTNSTYEIRVGRAEKITGPYLDRDGKNLTDGGGTLFLQSAGRFIGPGHVGILSDNHANGPTRFSYHYYDAATQGRSRLAIGAIDWSGGWPVATNLTLPSSPTPPQPLGTSNIERAEATAGEDTNNWKLVWSDEFNTDGAPNPANWNYEQGFVRNHELQWYQPENAVCTNGLLVIEARRERRRNPGYQPGSGNWGASREWADYTSASLTTRRLHEFTYGKFEMRARINTRAGSWPAFWTLGTGSARQRWPACGEVDIMEYYRDTVLANIGWQLNGRMHWRSTKKPLAEFGPDWSKDFHVWTMEWDDQRMDLLLDGRLMNRVDLADADQAEPRNPFHGPVYFILNQAIGGDSGGDPSQTEFPVRYEIDWVRVYQRTQ